MTETEKESKDLIENTNLKFTKGHEILLTGLIGSGMNYRDIFHIEMALTTEEEALELAKWILDKLDERDNNFPTPAEIFRQAGIELRT